MIKRLFAAFGLAAFLSIAISTPALANPGPGASNQCAPGQQGNQDPGFKPGSCDNK